MTHTPRTQRLFTAFTQTAGKVALTTLPLLALASVTMAQTWTGRGSNNGWSNAANWSGGVPNGTSSTASFAGGTPKTTVLLDADINLQSLVFNPSSGGVSTSFVVTEVGSDNYPHDWSLNIGSGGISNNTSVLQTINALVNLTGNTSFTTNAGGTTTFAGTASNSYNALNLGSYALTVNGAGNTNIASPVTGTGSLTKSGTGTLTLSGTNTYSGGTTINAGTVAVTDITALGTGNVTTATGGTLKLDLTGSVDYGTTFTGTGNVIKTGKGALSLLSGTPYSGNVAVQNGTLNVGDSSHSVSFADGSTIIVAYNRFGGADGTTVESGTLNFYNNSFSGNTNIINNGFVIFHDESSMGNASITNNSYLAFSDKSTGGKKTITNNGFLTFNDNSNASDTYIVNNTGGVISLINLQNEADLQVRSINGSGTINMGTHSLIIASSPAVDSTISGTISGTGGIEVANVSTLTLLGNHTYTGSTKVGFQSTLNVGDANHLTNLATSSFVVYQSALHFYNGSSPGSASISSNSFNASVTFHNNSTAGTASIGKSGSIKFYDNSSASNSKLTASSSKISFANSSSASNATVHAFGDQSVPSSLGFSNLSTAGNASISASYATVSFNDKASAGTATITGNTNSILSFNGSSTADTATIFNNAGSTLDISGMTTGLSVGSLNGAGGVSLGSNTLALGNLNKDDTVSGVISDSGNLTKTGTGTLILTGYNTYSGKTLVSAGNLKLDAAPNGSGNYGSTLSDSSAGLEIGAGAMVYTTQSFQIPLSIPVVLDDQQNGNVAELLFTNGTTHLLRNITLGDGAQVRGSAGSFLVLNGTSSVTVGAADTATINIPLGLQGDATMNVGKNGSLNMYGEIRDWYATGTITKNGDGLLVINDNSVYTGKTLVNGGTVRFGAATPSVSSPTTTAQTGGISVGAGGTLVGNAAFGTTSTVNGVTIGSTSLLASGAGARVMGIGQYGGITLGNGATLAPGNTASAAFGQTSASSLLVSGNTNFEFDLRSGGVSDKIALSGAFNYDTSSAGNLTFFFDAPTLDIGSGQLYTLMTFGSTNFTQADISSGKFIAAPRGSLSGITGQWILTGNRLQFQTQDVMVMPEPTDTALLAFPVLGTLGFVLRRRRMAA